MILTGSEIKRNVELGNINIEPFNEKQINPNSYNYRLGEELLELTGEIIDPKKPTNFKRIIIDEKEVTFSLKKAFSEIPELEDKIITTMNFIKKENATHIHKNECVQNLYNFLSCRNNLIWVPLIVFQKVCLP